MGLPLKPNTEGKELKDRIDLRKLLGRFHERDEEVLWAEYSASNQMPVTVLLASSILIGILGTILFISLKGQIHHYNTLLSISILFLLSFPILLIYSKLRSNRLSKTVNIITSERIIKQSSSSLLHRSISSVYYFRRQEDNVLFFEKLLDTINDREIFRFTQLKNSKEAHIAFYNIWEKRGPEGKLEEALKSLMERKGFQAENNNTNVKDFVFTKSLDGAQYIVSVFGLLPVKTIEVMLNCPNKENNFLLLYGQHASKQLVEDVEINDPEFDNSFIIQSDSRSFLDAVLTDRTRQYMLNCIGSSDCRYQFGKIGKVTKEMAVDTRSQFIDSEDVLDVQLLDHKTDRETPSLQTVAEEGTSSALQLTCRPESSMQFNIDAMVQLLENCVDSTVELGKGIEAYFK